jgi:6-phosphogluconolactonase/glucosamine-6-phosphate isomerase/deaminase
MEFKAGKVQVHVEVDEKAMGKEAAKLAVSSLKQAVDSGKRPVMWMMAAPSGFAFYKAFVTHVQNDTDLQEIIRETKFFQFDDYPVARDDARFPITFRHLLETRFFKPLEDIVGPLAGVHLLELTGNETDDSIIRDYEALLQETLDDDANFVLEIKGIGMDGHWGFHGRETPLDSKSGYMRVPMNDLNIQQQMLDWPQYFATAADVPTEAVTANVGLFMQADMVIDLVPQREKAFAILACYGPFAVSNLVPSSQLKTHGNAHSFLTEQASWALLEYREQVARGVGAISFDDGMVSKLSEIWKNPDNPEMEKHNREQMKQILSNLVNDAN